MGIVWRRGDTLSFPTVEGNVPGANLA